MAINWLSDDGVNLPMINDVPRNLFYDRILSKSVRGKKCCDIGFGTGLLSLLAIKHGASSIIAYEKDPERFNLGQQIIEDLKLKNKINLQHRLASSQDIEKTDCDVVFHEIIHQSIWAEGLWRIRPETPGTKEYVPGEYFFELYAAPIDDTTVDGFLNGDDSTEYFNPGVGIDTRFVDLINRFILQNDSKKIRSPNIDDHLIKLNWHKIHKDWSWNPGYVFKNYPKQLLCKYVVDYNKGKCTFFDSKGSRYMDLRTVSACEMSVDLSQWCDTNLLLESRFGLQHDQEKLYLDECRNWGAEVPWLYLKPKSSLLFTQDFEGIKQFHLSKTN